jgi:type I restriction enzyme S subunit
MVVEKRYKQTDIGLLPIDWELLPIDKIFSFYSTSNYSKAQMKFEGEVGCIHYGLIHAISNSAYNIKKGIKYYVSEAQANYEFIKNGDVIMVDASEDLEGVNKSIEIEGIVEDKYIAGLHTFLLRDTNSKLSKGYRGAILNSTPIKNQLLRLAVGMKVFGVSKPQLKTVLIPIPPYPEQTAIATALSDMDELIAQTEKLIEKKKAIKQGVMQELLRPKEGWVMKKLGDYGRTFGGITGKTKIDFGKGNSLYIPFMNIMSNPIIDVEYMDSVEIKPNERQNKVQKGDLFFNGSSETPEEVGLCSVLEKDVENVYLNSFCFGYRMHNSNELNGLFVCYLFRSQLGRSSIFSLAQGATRYNLSKTNLLKLELPMPSKEVQDDIALTLLDIDNLIQSNMRKLNKLKLKKQGMMQALLTGKIRLV